MNEPKKDCSYYMNQLDSLIKERMQIVYDQAKASGATVEEIKAALQAEVTEQHVAMICAGQEPSTN